MLQDGYSLQASVNLGAFAAELFEEFAVVVVGFDSHPNCAIALSKASDNTDFLKVIFMIRESLLS